jgi:hypothetical protein
MLFFQGRIDVEATDCYRGMAQVVANTFKPHTASQRMRGVRMTQPMEAGLSERPERLPYPVETPPSPTVEKPSLNKP